MPNGLSTPVNERIDAVSCLLAGLTLYLVVKLHLLAALFSGLLVFELINILAPQLRVGNLGGSRAKIAAVALLSAAIITLLTALVLATLTFFRSGAESLPTLAKMMAEILEGSRAQLPEGFADILPADVGDIKLGLAEWLRQHADDLRLAGQVVLRKLAHILIGMVIGALLALREAMAEHPRALLAAALFQRADRFSDAFRRVVFAQIRIAALNAFLTWLYLGIALPVLGLALPYTKTLVAVTFVAGLLPVLGNLISNFIIVIVSLSVSLQVAIGSLLFLVVIHKLEYFINAKIIGTRINARAWEMLLAMLVMEAAFGVVGLIAAPVYYAYLKDELKSRGLI